MSVYERSFKKVFTVAFAVYGLRLLSLQVNYSRTGANTGDKI